MVNYKDLGLVNTREMFKNAMAGNMQLQPLTLTTWNRCRPLSRQLSNVNHR